MIDVEVFSGAWLFEERAHGKRVRTGTGAGDGAAGHRVPGLSGAGRITQSLPRSRRDQRGAGRRAGAAAGARDHPPTGHSGGQLPPAPSDEGGLGAGRRLAEWRPGMAVLYSTGRSPVPRLRYRRTLDATHPGGARSRRALTTSPTLGIDARSAWHSRFTGCAPQRPGTMIPRRTAARESCYAVTLSATLDMVS